METMYRAKVRVSSEEFITIYPYSKHRTTFTSTKHAINALERWARNHTKILKKHGYLVGIVYSTNNSTMQEVYADKNTITIAL